MPDAYKNFAVSTVTTAPSPATSGTSLTIPSGESSRFPAVPFNAVVCPADELPVPTNSEVVRVTANSSGSLTITRAQESSTARSIVAGDLFFAGVTAKTLSDLEPVTENVQDFTSSGTYTKPTGSYRYVFVEILPPGGGGGGGTKLGQTNSNTGGGEGGMPGQRVTGLFAYVDLASTVSVTIGAAGTAGTAADSSGPGAGGNGGTHSFGSLLAARGGLGGRAGVAGTVYAKGRILGEGGAGAGGNNGSGLNGEAGNTGDDGSSGGSGGTGGHTPGGGSSGTDRGGGGGSGGAYAGGSGADGGNGGALGGGGGGGGSLWFYGVGSGGGESGAGGAGGIGRVRVRTF